MSDIRNLQRMLKTCIAVSDAECTWLTRHRPSVALLLCLGSGPWKYGRRKVVQSKALEILGERDLSELKEREITLIFPLEWQHKYLRLAMRYARACGGWDYACSRMRGRKLDIAEIFEVRKPPKVLSMFVRDFWLRDAFPVDRWVRRKLKEFELPTQERKILALFAELGLSPREYARGIFTAVSQNPVFPATKRKAMK